MAEQQENKNLNVNEGDFVKSDDKVTVADSGVGDGVDFAESLPGGGDSDNAIESSVTADEDEGFDHRNPDDAKS